MSHICALVSFAISDRMQHPPAVEWKVSDSGSGGGPMERHSCCSRAGQDPGQNHYSSVPLHSPLSSIINYLFLSMFTLHATWQIFGQSSFWFKMNTSQIHDTKGGEASVQAGAGELACIAKNSMGTLSQTAGWVQTKYN